MNFTSLHLVGALKFSTKVRFQNLRSVCRSKHERSNCICVKEVFSSQLWFYSAWGSHCRTKKSCFAVEWGKSSRLCTPQRHLLLAWLKGNSIFRVTILFLVTFSFNKWELRKSGSESFHLKQELCSLVLHEQLLQNLVLLWLKKHLQEFTKLT